MNNREEPKKCCSNLNCKQTAELEKTIAADLEQQDKSIEELLDDKETDAN
jgi:hypothetical protein